MCNWRLCDRIEVLTITVGMATYVIGQFIMIGLFDLFRTICNIHHIIV